MQRNCRSMGRSICGRWIAGPGHAGVQGRKSQRRRFDEWLQNNGAIRQYRRSNGQGATMAGVRIGRVTDIRIDRNDYTAVVELSIGSEHLIGQLVFSQTQGGTDE